jgi:hypothetical protein
MHLRDVYRAVSQSVRRAREAAVTACACRRGGAGRGVWWTPSGCCSRRGCARLRAACLQISGVAGPAGCPPAHTHVHLHLHTLMNGHTHERTHSCTNTLMHEHTHARTHSCTNTLIHEHTHARVHLRAYKLSFCHTCTGGAGILTLS